MCWLTLSKAGLILNALGSIILVIGSNMVTNLLTELIDSIKTTYGLVSMEPFEETIMTRFEQQKGTSSILNILGFSLFIIGFILQLF